MIPESDVSDYWRAWMPQRWDGTEWVDMRPEPATFSAASAAVRGAPANDRVRISYLEETTGSDEQ